MQSRRKVEDTDVSFCRDGTSVNRKELRPLFLFNVVQRVKRDSACGRAGIGPGDKIEKIGDHSIYSQADVSWALHNAPDQGQIAIQFTRTGTTVAVMLQLEKNWKETNLSWRASMRKEETPQRQK